MTSRPPILEPHAAEIIVKLADGTATKADIARQYGAKAPSVTRFCHKHATEIEQHRLALTTSLQGLSLANKEARIAERTELYYDTKARALDPRQRNAHWVAQARGLLMDIAIEQGLPKGDTNVQVNIGQLVRYIEGPQPS